MTELSAEYFKGLAEEKINQFLVDNSIDKDASPAPDLTGIIDTLTFVLAENRDYELVLTPVHDNDFNPHYVGVFMGQEHTGSSAYAYIKTSEKLRDSWR